jgi:N-acetylmuramoyl-L-alanine amidase
MKRKLVILGILLGLCVLPVTAWAAPPFGFIDDNTPGVGGGAGILGLTGWALDDNGVAWVDVYVDGAVAGRALYGFNRPGVSVLHPGYPNSAAPGWVFNLDTSQYLNGLHTVSAQVTTATGERGFLNSVLFEFLNTTTNLLPFGAIDHPRPNAELYGNCDLGGPRRYSVVTGYALDTGIEIGDTGVGYVELLIDGSLWANTRVDCAYDAARGGLSDCYGLRRLDVERSYPAIRDAPHSGFRFVLDVGFLIDYGYAQGFHVLTIRSGDVKGQVDEIAEVPVDFFCDDNIPNEGSFGDLDLPTQPLFAGTVSFTGWALDWEGIDDVLVYVDGEAFGSATRGLLRPGVTALYPGYPDSAAPGWIFTLDTTQVSNGSHNLQVVVRDQSMAAVQTVIGERVFSVDNHP